MARTQAADYEEKREAITKEAAKLFADKGFAGASVADLAEACGVSKSLIYHYYDAKEAILYDVMREHIDALLAAAEQTKKSRNDPGAQLRALTRELLRRYVGAADRQKVLLYELASLPDAARREIVAKQRAIIARVEELLGAANPHLRKDHAKLRTRAMLYFGMLNWTHTWFKANGPISRDGLADMAAETILASL
ncbi:MAG TPA: TetR/AcrR family transcriptional regulator [Parvularculaceae bacterium]|nr:TetR/AcrR family transcriptional regulator [Parvularculaceae bacterium]